MTKKKQQPVVRTYKAEWKGKMKRLQFPLILLLHGSDPDYWHYARFLCMCNKSPFTYDWSACGDGSSQPNPTARRCSWYHSTTTTSERQALKNKWSCMFSSLWPSMHWLTDVRQLPCSSDPLWPLPLPGFLLSPAKGQQFNCRPRGTCFDYS